MLHASQKNSLQPRCHQGTDHPDTHVCVAPAAEGAGGACLRLLASRGQSQRRNPLIEHQRLLGMSAQSSHVQVTRSLTWSWSRQMSLTLVYRSNSGWLMIRRRFLVCSSCSQLMSSMPPATMCRVAGIMFMQQLAAVITQSLSITAPPQKWVMPRLLRHNHDRHLKVSSTRFITRPS